MLSMPPATTMAAEPATSASCASIAACMPLPHILLTVTAATLSGRPAPRNACRAGAWPWPAPSTQPTMPRSTVSPGTPASATAARIAAAPSWLAVNPASAPWKPPIGVRRAATMTMGSAMESPFRHDMGRSASLVEIGKRMLAALVRGPAADAACDQRPAHRHEQRDHRGIGQHRGLGVG